MRSTNSLYLRLLIPLTGGLLLAMLLAWAIALKVLATAIEVQLDDRLATATATLADGTLPFSVELIERLDRLIESRILFLDPAGQIQLSSGDFDDSDAIMRLVGSAHWLEGVDEQLHTVSGADGAWRIAVRRLPGDNDNRFRYVAAAASLEKTTTASRDAALLLAGAMLLATIALIALGSYFVRSITRPVTDLANMASSISEGRRDIVAAVHERNEIGLLASTLNDMAQKIDSYERNLSETSHRAGLGDLASRMAHEIRNPLTAIKMQLEMLEERLDGPEQERASNVLDEIRRLELIVSSSLALGGGQGVN
ncbi:MAG: HAMP domain-containing protein, partial [Gammaproteobacteria bacterium]|nr:HAMP domain-containing protein [Gammaproteobacteria bacterium]